MVVRDHGEEEDGRRVNGSVSASKQSICRESLTHWTGASSNIRHRRVLICVTMTTCTKFVNQKVTKDIFIDNESRVAGSNGRLGESVVRSAMPVGVQ